MKNPQVSSKKWDNDNIVRIPRARLADFQKIMKQLNCKKPSEALSKLIDLYLENHEPMRVEALKTIKRVEECVREMSILIMTRGGMQ